MLFAYYGPETVMPLATVLAGLVGVILIAWRWLLAVGLNALGMIRGREPSRKIASPSPPRRARPTSRPLPLHDDPDPVADGHAGAPTSEGST